MCSSTPKAPKPPAPPPEAPTQVDAQVSGAHDREKKRQRAASGHSGTVMTGPMGVSGSANTGKTLLGT